MYTYFIVISCTYFLSTIQITDANTWCARHVFFTFCWRFSD